MLKPYTGCFAPTISGGLHFGELIVALASYLDAKSARGRWLLRFDDTNSTKDSDPILRTLVTYGFEWDSEPLYQRSCLAKYNEVVDRLFNQGLAYACTCSTELLKDYAIYPGFCRDALKSRKNAVVRLRAPGLNYRFTDRVQGLFSQHLGREVGDFIIMHQEGRIDYSLSVVLDDTAQGITMVVRSSDKLSLIPRQLYLQELLGYPSPHYLHVPILVDAAGVECRESPCHILSSSTPTNVLIEALKLLQQPVEDTLYQATPKQILKYATCRWCPDLIPKQHYIVIER